MPDRPQTVVFQMTLYAEIATHSVPLAEFCTRGYRAKGTCPNLPGFCCVFTFCTEIGAVNHTVKTGRLFCTGVPLLIAHKRDHAAWEFLKM